MFTFEKRDEGFMAFGPDGRGVASIDCGRVSFDDNPKFKAPERVLEKWPKEKWQIHFCSRRLSPVELAKFVEEVGKLEF